MALSSLNQAVSFRVKQPRFTAHTLLASTLLTGLCWQAVLPLQLHGDWPQFRGGGQGSQLAQAQVPATFDGASGENVAWKVALPGSGVSGPIVIGERVITTSSYGMEERRIAVTANDLTSGEQLWTREFKATGRPYCHASSDNAAPTPASDGQFIVGFFSSNDVICLDMEGNLQWCRGLTLDYPHAANDIGMSSSPLIIDGVVVVQVECQADSFAAGIDLRSGQNLWRLTRPKQANWASPLAFKNAAGQACVFLQSSQSALAVDPQSGATLWETKLSCAGIPSAAAVDDLLFVPSGGLTALQLTPSAASPVELWSNNKLNPNGGSCLVVGERVYAVNRSVLAAADKKTGELLSQTRLADAGSIWATPVVAGDRMYIFAEGGKCFVLSLSGKQPELLGTYELGEQVLGSPALAPDAILVRAKHNLWKIANK